MTSKSSNQSTYLTADEKDLFELFYYAGVTIDPQVEKIIVDLLNKDIHPQAILDVIVKLAARSKYASAAAAPSEQQQQLQVKTSSSARESSRERRLQREVAKSQHTRVKATLGSATTKPVSVQGSRNVPLKKSYARKTEKPAK